MASSNPSSNLRKTLLATVLGGAVLVLIPVATLRIDDAIRLKNAKEQLEVYMERLVEKLHIAGLEEDTLGEYNFDASNLTKDEIMGRYGFMSNGGYEIVEGFVDMLIGLEELKGALEENPFQDWDATFE